MNQRTARLLLRFATLTEGNHRHEKRKWTRLPWRARRKRRREIREAITAKRKAEAPA